MRMAKAKRIRTRRDPRTAVQKAIDARVADNRAEWARRHPGKAAAERALRKANLRRKDAWDHKLEGTAETHDHAARQEGALHRLYRTGAIDAEQLQSAADIAAVAERIAADVTVKTASLETRIDAGQRGDGTFHERLAMVRREMAYTRWRADLPQPAPVLDMLTGEPVGFTIVARRYGMHHRKAKRLLIDALDRWPAVLGETYKLVDHEALNAAHARMHG